MSLRRNHPETRKELDSEILRLRRQILSFLDTILATFQIAALVDEIQLLEAKKASLLRPWKVSRPKSERSLSAWEAI